MGILGIILAIVGLGILIIGVFALVGAGTTASALGLGDAATTVLSGIGSFIASYWQVFAAFLAIGLIAYVARRGTGSGGLGFERAAGAAEGITKGLTSEGESSSVTSGPSSDPPTTTPTGGGDTDDSTSSSDSSTNVNVQQQQQQMQQLLQAIVMNNLSQTPAGAYAPQQQQQQQMIIGEGLSPNVYNTFLQQIQTTQVNQQQMINQLMQFIIENGYNGVGDQVLVQFMKQVMDVDINIREVVSEDQGGDPPDDNEKEAIIIVDDVEAEIREILSNLEKYENSEKASIEEKREAIRELKDVFQSLKNEEELLQAIVIASESNASTEKGSQALATSIQRMLEGTGKDITDIANKADEIDGIWREIADAEKHIKNSFENDLEIYRSIETKDYNLDQIAELHKRMKKGINILKNTDWSKYDNP